VITTLFSVIFAAMKILMICLGNICRSPMAEGILQHKANRAGLDWTVDSAGTAGYHIGQAPHPLALKVAKLNGVDISGLRGRQFVKEDMQRFDRIYVMDTNNYADVKRMSRNLWEEKKTDLLLNELYLGQNREVPDPWYGTEKDFHLVYAMMDQAAEAIIRKYGS
jgi:protein-tyrosine phosphatase